MGLLKNKKVLVIGAHADDEALGCGGVIAKLASAGQCVDVLIITDSTSSQYADDQHLQSKSENRESALSRSCQILGVNSFTQLDFPDMRLDTVPHIELNKAISRHIDQGQYDVIFTHYFSDVNKDHQCVYESTLVATRPMPGQLVKTVLCYYTPSATEWGSFGGGESFSPDVFFDISATLEKKLSAFSAYEDEIRAYPHPRCEENITHIAKVFGASVGVDCAEAFKLVRHLDAS